MLRLGEMLGRDLRAAARALAVVAARLDRGVGEGLLVVLRLLRGRDHGDSSWAVGFAVAPAGCCFTTAEAATGPLERTMPCLTPS